MRFSIVVSRDSRPFEEQTALVSLPPLVLRPQLQHLTELYIALGFAILCPGSIISILTSSAILDCGIGGSVINMSR
jgi:hypothetical protein